MHIRRSTRRHDDLHDNDDQDVDDVLNDDYRQFDAVGQDATETIKDSIHLDWVTTRPECPECGCVVRLWDTFAHRLIYNQTFPKSVAFQVISGLSVMKE